MIAAMRRAFLEQFARIGKAMASPSRLELLDLLSQSEKSVETLVEQSSLNLKNASAQLKILKDAGLVKARREGKYVFYSLSDETVGAFWSNLQEFSARRLAELQKLSTELMSDPDLVGLSRKELLARAKRDEVLLLDVRPEDEFLAGHLPYAKSIPLAELKSRLSKLPKNKEIVAYCRGPHCLFAVEAVRLLKKSGHKAKRLDDGVQEWKAAGFPITA
jgi:rhodanese-related sulfurtransferase